MRLKTEQRSRAAVGLVAAAATAAGTVLLATPAVADDDPAAGLSCQVQNDGQASNLEVYCYDEVASGVATVVEYQWERDGVAIPGATGSTYRYQAEDSGHLFSATVGVDRAGTRVTVPIGRAAAPGRGALFLMDSCHVEVSNINGHQGGMTLLEGAHLNDTLTLEVRPKVASNLTVAGPYWTMTTASYGEYTLPPVLAEQGQGWTVKLSDLASIDAILSEPQFSDVGRRNLINRAERGQVEVRNSFTVKSGDVSATIEGCPWGPDTPSGQLDDGVFFGSPTRYMRTPSFPIARHTASDTGVQGTLEANYGGWNPIGLNDVATFTYQWTRDGQAIPGATSASYTLTPKDSGKKIGLVIWGTVHETSVWVWGEVTAGQIKAPTADPTGSATPSPTGSATASPAGPAPASPSSRPVRSVVGLIVWLLQLLR